MTWFSEYSASPRRRLASSAIRCPSVDRFAGFSAPSRVSGQRSSLRDASLPSIGSRRARFPDFSGTTKALRLPVCVYPVPYGFGSRLHVLLRVRVRHGAPAAAKVRSRARGLWSAGLPLSGGLHGGTHGISQVSWRSIPHLCPDLRPRPDQQDLALIGPADAAPGTNTPKAPAKRDLGAQPRALVSAAYASRAALPPPMQGSLPAGGLRPLPGGSRTLWSAMKDFRLHPSSFPGLCLTQIGRTLHAAGFGWQKSRTWCETGVVVRKRQQGGLVSVTDPDAAAKRG
jgi:hypothetical protein